MRSSHVIKPQREIFRLDKKMSNIKSVCTVGRSDNQPVGFYHYCEDRVQLAGWVCGVFALLNRQLTKKEKPVENTDVEAFPLYGPHVSPPKASLLSFYFLLSHFKELFTYHVCS